ncbi:MAG TPA: GYF domain-containing protein [Myxococcaceae bacterium]|nr:GYF domain-containing protein [Myxococcaceae bacterium]
MAEQPDPSQPQPPAEGGEAQRSPSMMDTLAEAQALAALDELIAKVDSVGEANGSAAAQGRPEQERQEPAEAYALTGDAPPFDGWYVAMKDNAHGPLTVEDLTDRWSRGEIGAETLCWREGMSEWRPLSRLHALTSAIVPRPREGLKALSSKPPVRSQPASFAPSASKMLKSLAEQEREAQTDRLVGAVAVPASLAASPASAEARPPTSPTTPEGPKRVQPPAVKPPMFSAERRYEDEDEEEAPRRAAGVSGARLFASLFAASVLGGVVGGYVVKVTMPPPPAPAPVVIHEPVPTATAPVAQPPPPPATAVQPPAPARVEMPPAKVEAKPKPAAKPPVEGEAAAAKTPPAPKKPATLPPPKNQLDKDFQDTFGN